MAKVLKMEHNHVHQALLALGFSDNEALLYEIMVRNPRSTVQELQKRTPFTRTMVYHVLNGLIRRGLVTALKNDWRTVYDLEDPERLYDLLDLKQKEFEQKKVDVRSIIPELKNTFRISGSRPNIRLFEGLEQYENALNGVLDSKAGIIYAYIPSSYFNNPGVELRKEFTKKRIAKGIELKLLVFDKDTAQQIVKGNPVDPFREVRLFSLIDQASISDLQMYDGRLLYTRFEKREPIVALIEDQPLYKMQKALFLKLWETATIFKR